MTASPYPHEVRQIVVQTFAEFGARRSQLLKETLLVDGGRYMARSYRLHGLLAMWLVEEGVLQFFDAQHRLLRTINLWEQMVPQRMAA
jgi:hypothetical protein